MNRLTAGWNVVFPAVCLSGILLAAGAFAQTTRYVATTGSDIDGDGSLDNPWLTISNGVAQAATGDTVLAATGTYAVSVNVIVAKNLTLRSWNQGAGGLEDRENTIIDGGGICAPLYINHAEGLVSGFTITNGNGIGGAHVLFGGGVYMKGGILTNCIIAGNICDRFGGGVYMTNNALLANCLLIGNSVTSTIAAWGGGMYVDSGCKVINSECISNSALTLGAGIFCAASTIVSNCLLAGNKANLAGGNGGGIHVYGTNVLIVDSVISNNTSGGLAGGIGVGGVGFPAIMNCTVTCNSARYAGGGVHLRTSAAGGALITNSVISYNHITENAFYGSGLCDGYNIGATSTGTLTVVGTDFIGNGGTNDRNGGGAMIYTHGTAVFHNCRFMGNKLEYSGSSGPGLYIGTGSACVVVRNCLIASNNAAGAYGDGGGIFFSGGVGGKSGARPFTASVESCTLAHNTVVRDYGGMNATNGVSVLNCVVVSNTAGGLYPDLRGDAENIARFSNSCSPALTNAENGNIADLPVFVDYADGNYRLAAGSPGINAGTNQTWMIGAADLDGRPRLDRFTRLADMGCYEQTPSGTLFGFK